MRGVTDTGGGDEVVRLETSELCLWGECVESILLPLTPFVIEWADQSSNASHGDNLERQCGPSRSHRLSKLSINSLG